MLIFYKAIFSKTPYNSFVDFYFSLKNDGIAKGYNKCIYFNKINAFPNVGPFSSFGTQIKKNFKDLWLHNSEYKHLYLNKMNPFRLKAFLEFVNLNASKGVSHFGVEGPDTHPLLFKTTTKNLSKYSSNVFTALDLKRLTDFEVVQGCQDAYLPDSHRDITLAANNNFLRHTIQINAYVLSEKLINGTLIEHEGLLHQVGLNGVHTEVDVEITEFFKYVAVEKQRTFCIMD